MLEQSGICSFCAKDGEAIMLIAAMSDTIITLEKHKDCK
jgi:hypothetical protein